MTLATPQTIRDHGNSGVTTVTWSGVATGTTEDSWSPSHQEMAFADVQFIGVDAGVTLILEASNDGTNWVTAKDILGTAISVTAADGAFEISSAAKHFRPSASGGTGDSATVIICARG